MRAFVGIVVALVLTACGAGPNTQPQLAKSEAAVEEDMSVGAGAPETTASTARAEKTEANAPSPTTPVAGAMLAFTYKAGLTLPAERIRPVMAAHEKACAQAGSAVCQVIGSRISQPRDDVVEGGLELRARPDFAQAFSQRLEGDAASEKGRIEQSRTSEDLTRQIIDSEATLRAKTTLRDRLQALLRDRPGRLSDLLETEQALAAVQQEIDSTQSYLAEMRQRVATSRVTIRYASTPSAVGGGVFDPMGDALNGFLRLVSINAAAIISLFAMLAPWLLVGGPLVWFGWKVLKRRLPGAQNSATSGDRQPPAA